MAVKPILHRIIVRQDKLDEKDSKFASARRAGIVVIEDEHKREQAAIDTGVVVEIGPTAFRDFGLDAPPIQVGDTVVFAKYAGKAVEDPTTQEKFVALNDEDIVCVVTKEPKNG